MQTETHVMPDPFAGGAINATNEDAIIMYALFIPAYNKNDLDDKIFSFLLP